MKPSLQPGVASRVAAARVLDAVLHDGRSLKSELANALPALADPRDRALVEAIVFAALRRRARYDAALAAWMPRPPGRRDGIVRALLHAGFAQLEALGLPAHAAVAATVDAARALGRTHQAGMVNALLRRAQRDGMPEADPASAWPGWLREQLQRDWPDDVDAILRASAEAGPLWLRVNTRRTGVDAMQARLRDSRIEAVSTPLCPQGLRIDAPVPVSALPGFADGDLSVQDGSAQLVAEALSPPRGARVLDACAAPGGKAAHLLERDPALQLLALDVDAERLRRIAATFTRLAIGSTAALRQADAADTGAWWDGRPFDAILLDAPCSATGVVRRQPDILLHRRESDIVALCATQARLLDALWPTLAPGGALLYATCSILRRENDAQVAAFLARTADAGIEPLDARFGRPVPAGTGGYGHQRLPGDDGMDGFFYARIRKA
ncbi:MAG: 16S rRNA (cytosine(967)-C(5))-methyltransferase RsmB [Luteimonas sp.]